MSSRIAFKKSAARDLKKLYEAKAARILKKIAEDLPDKANRFPVLSGKFAGLRKFRIGDYRVIFTIREEMVLVFRISHLRECYLS